MQRNDILQILLPILWLLGNTTLQASEEPLFAPPPIEMLPTIVEEPDQVSDTESYFQLTKILMERDETLHEVEAYMQKLLVSSPDHVSGKLLYIHYLILVHNFSKANAAVSAFMQQLPEKVYELVDLAGIQAELGNALASQELFALAAQKEMNEEERAFYAFHFARGRELWGDWVLSEETLRPLAMKEGASLYEKMEYGTLLVRSQKLAQAEQWYRQVMLETEKPDPLYALIALKLEQRDYNAAQLLIESVPAAFKTKERLLAMEGNLYYHIGEFCKAEEIFIHLAESLQFEPRKAQYLSQAGKAAYQRGNIDQARLYFEKAVTLYPLLTAPHFYLALLDDQFEATWSALLLAQYAPQTLNEWSGLFIEEGFIQAAIELNESIRNSHPNYFITQWAQANLFAGAFDYNASAIVYESLYEDFPNSQMIFLQLSRVYSWSKLYAIAICMYDRLIGQDPLNALFLFEKAHVQLWGHYIPASIETYGILMAGNFSSDCSSTLCLADWQLECPPPLNDLSNWLIHRKAYLEMTAKLAVWNNLPFEALCHYERLLAFSPGNTEAWYEYAQVWHSLNMCVEARESYNTLLCLDSNNTLAQLAIERLDYQQSPKIYDYYTLWCEQGYGVLSGITRHKIQCKLQGYTDCNTSYGVYDILFSDHPYMHGGSFNTQALGVEMKKTMNEHCSFEFSVAEKYANNYKLKHRSLANVQFLFRPTDRLIGSCGYDKVDEFYNYFGLRQDVQSNSFWGRLGYFVTRKWQLEAYYKYLMYTDHNSLNYAVLSSYYQFTDAPKVLRCTLQGEYRNTKYPAIFIYNGPNLVNIIHPYWSPQDYFAGRIMMEWFHDLTCLDFSGAEKNTYALRAMIGTDTDNNNACSIGGDWHYDWGNSWSFQISGLLHYSRLWKAAGLWSQLSYAF